MSVETDARQITLNYAGGSVEMSIGNAKDIFGADFSGLNPGSEAKSVSVKAHSRVRVIGGPTKQVSAYTYEYEQFPTSRASNSSTGTVILMSWEGSGGDFTGRVSGSLAKASKFFEANVKKTLRFRSQRGTKYGPFPAIS
tara:strand:- start:209 stop:628 length:420 start_codon:yes stop_codon:yes gene_type:complete